MKNIIISPYAKPLRNGKENPKDYPYWEALVGGLRGAGYSIVQLAFGDEKKIESAHHIICYKSLSAVEMVVDDCDLFISIDNFLPHLAHCRKKRGIVLWGKSDPELFGYPENVNLLKDRKFLRNRQFDIWEAEEFDPAVFVAPEIVMEAVLKFDVLKS